MKVVYDISNFGEAELRPRSRAGIYRYVHSLAAGLAASGRCELKFSAFEADWNYYVTKHVLDSEEYREIYLPRFPHSMAHQQLTKWYFRTCERVAGAAGVKRVGWRLARKMTHLAQGMFDEDAENDVNLEEADIYHSPFYAIPERVRRHKKAKPFLSVMDLIAILQPQFFEGPTTGGEHPVKTIVDGIRREDWVACISQSTKDDLCNYRKDLDPRRVFVTRLGASRWFYRCKEAKTIEAARAKYKIPPGRYVLSVCTLEPRKNLGHLIRCFARWTAQERLRDVHLVLVGSLGWKYESIYAELTAAEGLRERIVITGFVADEDMAALYSGALFFVYPSLYEGFGLPPLEAMQCGVPVITSNTSSLPEVVGDAGIMVDPQDTDALCGAMSRLGNDEGERAALAEKSLQQARQFSWTQCASQTLDAYQAALGAG